MAAAIALTPFAAAQAVRLTAATQFSCDQAGAMDMAHAWNTTQQDDFWDLFWAPGVPGGSPDGFTQPFLNGPDDAEVMLDIPLQPGANHFAIFGNMGSARPCFALNLFFDGHAAPAISVKAEPRTADPIPPFNANDSACTLGLEGWTPVPGAGKLVYQQGPTTVTLADFYLAPADTVFSIDRVDAFSASPAPGNDSVTFVSLRVQTASAPPTIVTQPLAQSVTVGQTATFTVVATGAAPFSYRWRKNGEDLTDAGGVGGVRTATLTLANAQLTDAGDYTVVVTNADGSATSETAKLTVTPSPPVTLLAPEARTAVEISYPTVENASYQLQSSVDISSWENVGAEIAGQSGTARWYASTRPPRADEFFRIRTTSGGQVSCLPFDWNVVSEVLPSAAFPPMTLSDRSEPEDPILANGELILANDARAEYMWYSQSGTSLQVPAKLVIEAVMKFGTGLSEKRGRATASIGFATAAWTGGLIGFGLDEVFFSYDADSRGETAVVDTDGAYHLYRIEMDDAPTFFTPIRLYQDNELILTDVVQFNYLNFGEVPEIWFGDGTEWAYGSSSWKSFKHNALYCPSPTTGREVQIRKALEVYWPSEVGKTYQAQWANALEPNHWTNLGALQEGTGSVLSTFDSAPDSERKTYRVQVTP